MRTSEEINQEIENLETMKPTVRQTSAFGDNNHDSIDCQIEVLRECMSEDDVYDRNESACEDELFHCQNELDSALEAARWLLGDSDDIPSEGWEPLVVS